MMGEELPQGPFVRSTSSSTRLYRALLAAGLLVLALACAWSTARGDGLPVSAGFPPVPTLADLVERVQGAVVNIKTTRRSERREGDPFSWFFGGAPPSRDQTSLGTGFVIDERGHLLTNHHVVKGANQIRVQFADGKEVPAQVVGSDPPTDVAVLKIEPFAGLKAASLGDSQGLRVGDWVVAVGNPFGYGHTVTAGIVSAKGRILGEGIQDQFIQTDASINPGNSGGPLFNLQGEVVGINTAIYARGQGLGFAVPIHTAQEVFPQLIARGKVVRGWAGWWTDDGEDFVLLKAVHPFTPAAEAGLQPGDRLIRVAGMEVKSSGDVGRALGVSAPGTRVQVEVEREGKVEAASLTLVERDAWVERVTGKPHSVPLLGIRVRPIAADGIERLGVRPNQGLEVVEVEEPGPSGKVLRQGDVLLSLEEATLGSIEALEAVLEIVSEGEVVRVSRVRERSATRVRIRVSSSGKSL